MAPGSPATLGPEGTGLPALALPRDLPTQTRDIPMACVPISLSHSQLRHLICWVSQGPAPWQPPSTCLREAQARTWTAATLAELASDLSPCVSPMPHLTAKEPSTTPSRDSEGCVRSCVGLSSAQLMCQQLCSVWC